MTRKSPANVPRVLEPLYGLVNLGFQAGIAVFVLVSGYLLWGIISGSLADSVNLLREDRIRIAGNVLFSCKILVIAGAVLIASAAFRFFYEEILGYLLLIGGALLFWGLPIALRPTLERLSLEAASLPVYILGQFRVIGIVGLVAAVPFILADFWAKLRGVKRAPPGVAPVRRVDMPRSRLYLFCWQMPYCREYLRKFCKAYEERKACWRIKSGCYCDEEMIVRVMKRSKTSKLPGFDMRYSQVAGYGRSRDLAPAQKRERCRQCFLYSEHQKQKYLILSPLMFPIAIVIMWTQFRPVKGMLHKALEFTDRFAGTISFGPGPGQVAQNPWASTAAASNSVEWLFLMCIGLILVSYLLQGLEWAIFKLQV